MNKTHLVIEGDTWDYLAFKYYGNEYLYGALITANPKYANFDILPSGVEIIIPDIPETNVKKQKSLW